MPRGIPAGHRHPRVQRDWPVSGCLPMNSCLKQADGNIRKMCRSVRTILMKTVRHKVRPVRRNILKRNRQSRLNRVHLRADQNRTGTAIPARLLKTNRSMKSTASRSIGKKGIHPAADAGNDLFPEKNTNKLNAKGQQKSFPAALCENSNTVYFLL